MHESIAAFLERGTSYGKYIVKDVPHSLVWFPINMKSRYEVIDQLIGIINRKYSLGEVFTHMCYILEIKMRRSCLGKLGEEITV